MTHWTRTHPRAKKPHNCDSCWRTIRPGERYLRGVGLDGTAWTWKECGHCELLSEFVVSAYGLEEYGGDDLHEWEPANVSELRVKVQFKKRWARTDGTLYPLPEQVTRAQDLGHGFGVTHVVGILPGESIKGAKVA